MNVHLKTPVAPPVYFPARTQAPASRPRLDSIDLLRGLVMVVMALDHTRDFFGSSGMNPRDVADPALFLTRWITHFCAPIFIMLAGVSAYLYGAEGTRHRRTQPLSLHARLLADRAGVHSRPPRLDVRPGARTIFVMQVIWAIGASMVVLAALVWLPRAAIAAIGLAMIVGHNLLDGIRADDFGCARLDLEHPAPARAVAGRRRPRSSMSSTRSFPGPGSWPPAMRSDRSFALDPATRRRRFLIGGALLTAGFIVLRFTNLYGDPAPWIAHESSLSTVLSMMNVEKYPPSLLYLMMTLGPGLMLLAAFEHARGRFAAWITTFGRVPMLYYVAHVFLIHALAVVYAWAVLGDASWLFGGLPSAKPAGFGLTLPWVYAVWIGVVVALYPLCRWFAAVKARRSDWWLSYL